MLKSLKSEKEEVESLKVVKLMCKSGGFHLAKFLTDSKKVLEAVQHVIEEKFSWNVTSIINLCQQKQH